MAARGTCLLATPIGPVGIGWSALGIACLHLPDRDRDATRHGIVLRFPNAPEAEPPASVRGAIDAVLALLRGEPADLSGVAVDLVGASPFEQSVYRVARTIRPGRTMTYGEVASELGEPTAARAVGRALGRNPVPIIVPCHRVLAAGGAFGGFSAYGGAETKRRLLAIEGTAIGGQLALL